jgi:glycopeptide antibiotics resistance protein
VSRSRFFATILVLYGLVVAAITLTPGTESAPPSWIPFTQIYDVLNGPGGAYADAGQLLGNIVLFVPLGWLLPMTWPSLRSPLRIVAVGAACSAAIELSQLLVIVGRSPSVDDIILNILGALIGAVMFFAPRAG